MRKASVHYLLIRWDFSDSLVADADTGTSGSTNLLDKLLVVAPLEKGGTELNIGAENCN